MRASPFAAITVVLGPEDPRAAWVAETLHQSGVLFETLNGFNCDALSRSDILILAGKGSIARPNHEEVQKWITEGGALLCIGSTWGLDAILGVEPGPRVPVTLVPPHRNEPFWPEDAPAMRAYGVQTVQPSQTRPCLRDESGRTLATRAGGASFLGIHPGVGSDLIGLGTAVECDSVGPLAGDVDLQDGVGRTEDAIARDWSADRTGTPSHFATAPLETLREIVLRMVLDAAERSKKRLLLLWPWPENAPAVACLSLDCEDLDPKVVVEGYGRLTQYGMPASWFVPNPGLPTELYRAFRKWEHGLGLLFRPDDNWTEEQFRTQYMTLARGSGLPVLASFRAAEGRWRGRLRPYQLAAECGARAAFSRGGRHIGSSGYAFGFARPFAVPGCADMLELPFALHNPGLAPLELVDSLATEALRTSGCLHMSAAVRHLVDKEAGPAFSQALAQLRSRGVVFISPDRVAANDRVRRRLRVRMIDDQVTFVAEAPFEGFTFLVSGPRVSGFVGGRRHSPIPVERYGREWTPFTLDLDQKTQAAVQLERHVPSLV